MPVEEAAEHLELPAQGEGKARKKSGDECFYFYQGKQLHMVKIKTEFKWKPSGWEEIPSFKIKSLVEAIGREMCL